MYPKDKDAGIHGGIALTGFIDVEKLITVKYNHKKRETIFREKVAVSNCCIKCRNTT
ncbi:hypothetical protein bthur0012_57760 [Bacillus thuringiensis serovar pulsiensis BGSC 4CC1]|nr:hypothetical protein bthur0012_57760 [Bacillus thuringiensis serovar pulsiensis BGSC 4CC1]